MKKQGTRNIGRRIGIILLALTLGICISPVSVHATEYDGEEAARAARYNAELRRDGWLDMRDISYKGKDCTNFVSHCLRAGGLVTHMPNSRDVCKGVNKITGFWFLAKKKGKDAWSASWSIVTDLREYMNRVDYSDSNQKAMVIRHLFQKNETGDAHFEKMLSGLKLGDVVQYDENGYRHSVIITREGNNAEACKYSAHNEDRMNAPMSWFRTRAKDVCSVPGMPGWYSVYVISMSK